MLLVSQRVMSPASGDQAIHTYRYVHGWMVEEGMDPRVLFDEPAVLQSREVVIVGGGNRVRSFLDFAGPDEANFVEVLRCAGHLASLPAPPAHALWPPDERIAVQFGADAALLQTWRRELWRLVNALIPIAAGQ